MKTKLFYGVLLYFICSLFSTQVTAQTVGETFTDSVGINYEVTLVGTPNEVKIIDYTGVNKDVVIPETITNASNSYSVTEIGSAAFYGDKLTSIAIANTVKTIGRNAFYQNLFTNVTIPSSVTSIEGNAFATNSGSTIETVTLESETAITFSNSVFDLYGNDNYAIDLTIPVGLEQDYIDQGWIYFKTMNSKEYTFILDDIVYQVFDIANKIVGVVDYDNRATSTVVNIPSTVSSSGTIYDVTSIEKDAFRNESLTSVAIGDSVTTIGFRAFESNSLTNIIIPDSVNIISAAAFYKNELTSVTIPGNVNTIGSTAFHSNSNLTEVIYKSINPATLLPVTFDDNSQIDLIIPSGTLSAYTTANWTGFKSIAQSLDNTTAKLITTATNGTIATDITATNGIYVSGTVVALTATPNAGYQFDGWSGDLSGTTNPISITMDADKSVTPMFRIATPLSVGSTFSDADGIEYQVTKLGTPNEVTVFNYRGSSKVVDIPSTATFNNISYTVTIIGFDAFTAKLLTSITIPDTVTEIASYAFFGNKFTSITIPNSVTRISSFAFQNNPNLTEVIAEGTSPFILGVFENRNLIDLTVPSGLESSYLAAYWIGFKTINNIPSIFTVNEIDYALIDTIDNEVIILDYTGGNTIVAIPNTVDNLNVTYNVTQIGSDAFANKSLTRVTIPNSITRIFTRAFWDNATLTEVISESTNPVTFSEFFFDDDSLIDLFIPANTRAAYFNAGWTGFKSVTENATASIVDNEFNNTVKIYPNPVKNTLHISLATGETLENVQVFNLLGKKVAEINTLSIDFGNLTSGIYILKIENSKGKIAVRKIVKK